MWVGQSPVPTEPSLRVMLVQVSDVWVKEPPDDSSSQLLSHSSAIHVFPAEAPDTMEQSSCALSEFLTH